MDDIARKSLGAGTVQPTYLGKSLTSNYVLGGEDACAVANGGHPDKSKLAWATEILAAVIRTAGENPDAPFTTEALQAAAIVEEQELTTFLRYRRNLKERHIPITELDEGLRRLKARQRAAARAPVVAANSAGPAPAKGGSSSCPSPSRGRLPWMARSCWMNYPRPSAGTWSRRLRRCTRSRCGCSLPTCSMPLRPAPA